MIRILLIVFAALSFFSNTSWADSIPLPTAKSKVWRCTSKTYDFYIWMIGPDPDPWLYLVDWKVIFVRIGKEDFPTGLSHTLKESDPEHSGASFSGYYAFMSSSVRGEPDLFFNNSASNLEVGESFDGTYRRQKLIKCIRVRNR